MVLPFPPSIQEITLKVFLWNLMVVFLLASTFFDL